MPDLYMDVDVALSEVPVNVMPLLDDTDFKSREESLTYDQAGMDLVWNFVTTAGAYTQTAVTPTTGGVYDWTNEGNGMYAIEIPASGGASINNDTEGFGWFTGYATGVLPWRGPTIGFRAAALNNALIDGGDVLDVSLTEIGGVAQSAADLKDFADTGYDPTPHKVTGVVLADTATSVTNAVLVSAGTGAGQLDFTSGVIKANLAQILGTALTETAGQIAAAFKKFFDKAAPTGTINSLPDAVAGANGGLPTTNGTKVSQTVDLTAGQSIAVSGYSAGQDPATLLLVTPANKINTDAANAVKIQKMAVTLATGDVSGNLPTDVKAYTVQPTVSGVTLAADQTVNVTKWGGVAVGGMPNSTAPDNASITAIKAKTDNLPSGIQKNTALANFEFAMTDSTDHVTAKTGLTITAQRSIDGGAFASCTNSASEVGSGVYKINLSASDLNGDVITLRFSGTSADDCLITVVTEP